MVDDHSFAIGLIDGILVSKEIPRWPTTNWALSAGATWPRRCFAV